jgi:hypothetical protein
MLMRVTVWRNPIALLAGIWLTLGTAPAVSAQAVRPDDAARLLAGLEPEPGSAIASWTGDAGWRNHKAQFDRSWRTLEERQMSKVRAWSDHNLKSHSSVVLYMFSGPDFLYANAIYPHAATYILTGLEPPGHIPQLDANFRRAMPNALADLRASLTSVMSYSFFITRKMKTNLTSSELLGTLPPMLVFLARSGKTIHEVTLVELQRSGEVVRRGKDLSESASAGVEILFSGPDRDGEPAPRQRLYYFQTDLSDAGISASGLLALLARHEMADSLIKSASYLMHTPRFARIRQVLLDRSAKVVQDDSGIPVHFFSEKDFQLQPFGRYLGPIEEFPGRYQPRLAEVFHKAPPIDFGIGYRWRPNESNLMVAHRKTPGQELVVSAAPPAAVPAGERTEREPSPTRRATPRRQQTIWSILGF